MQTSRRSNKSAAGGSRGKTGEDAPRGDPAGGAEALLLRELRDLVPRGERAERAILAAGTERAGANPSDRYLQELWLVLSRLAWQSLVVVPAHAEGSIDGFVRSLAQAGSDLGDVPVASASLRYMEAEAAGSLASLILEGRGDFDADSADGQEASFDSRNRRPSQRPQGPAPHRRPRGRLIVGVPAVVAEPVGIRVTDAADWVLLGVELGVSTLMDVKRSIELIGRRKIAGCVLLHP